MRLRFPVALLCIAARVGFVLPRALADGLSPDSVGHDRPSLGVSPMLVSAAAEVWSVIARPDNPVWPGWNASDTPLAHQRGDA